MKCKIVNGKKICRKSYSPFRMCGSWVGAVVMGIIMSLPAIYSDTDIQSVPKFIVWIGDTFLFPSFGMFIIFPFYLIFGFLLGWGLTILYRKVFK